MSYEINPVLLDVAKWAAVGKQEKRGFVPPGGGMPPMDPAAMGGAPPMGPPPGAPPMGPPPAAPPADPAAAAPAPPAGGSKKIDPAFLYMEMSRVRKLLTALFQNLDMQLPPDVLDDNSVAQVMSGQIPESTPIGQEPQAPAGGGGDAPSLPGIGGSGPVGPVEAPKTASVKDLFSNKNSIGVGTQIKASSHSSNDMIDALAKLSRSLNNNA